MPNNSTILGKVMDNRDNSALLSLLENKFGVLENGWNYVLGQPQHGGFTGAYKEHRGRIWISEYLGDIYVTDDGTVVLGAVRDE